MPPPQQEGLETQEAGQGGVASAPNIGPQALPPEREPISEVPEGMVTETSGAEQRQSEGEDERPESPPEARDGSGGASAPVQEAAAGGRRVVGPAMPPPELLAAAAEAKQAV